MRKIDVLTLICFLFFLTGFSESSAQGTIDAEIRPRTELRSGFNQPLSDTLKSSFFTIQRTRINFNYTSGLLNARLTLQDARVFGETDTRQLTTATAGNISIYEAWAEILLVSGTRFKIGRQGIQFEDGRLFSLSPWSNTGNAHDLMQLQYTSKDLGVQLGYALNNQNTLNADTLYYSISKMYKQLAFLHLTKTIVPGLDLSLLGVNEGFQQSRADLNLYHRYTTGGTLQLKNEKQPLGFLLTGYYQFGKSTPNIKLNAWLLALKATYTFTCKINGLAGIDYYSGSKNSLPATKTNTFNKLPYGVNHSFNGYLEYWATLPKGGLVNYLGGVSLKINRKLSSDITYYGFILAKEMNVSVKREQSQIYLSFIGQEKHLLEMEAENNHVPKNIGSEVDFVLNYKLSSVTAVQAAWCCYFANNGTNLLKYKKATVNTRFPQYAYLMLTVRPQFCKTSSPEIN